MAAPPLEVGAVQDTVALVAVMFDAVGAAGRLGAVVGMTKVVSVDVADAGESPTLLWAVTRNSYVVLFAKLASVVVVAGAVTVTVFHALAVEERYSTR